jgi:hypothetical protein
MSRSPGDISRNNAKCLAVDVTDALALTNAGDFFDGGTSEDLLQPD